MLVENLSGAHTMAEVEANLRLDASYTAEFLISGFLPFGNQTIHILGQNRAFCFRCLLTLHPHNPVSGASRRVPWR